MKIKRKYKGIKLTKTFFAVCAFVGVVFSMWCLTDSEYLLVSSRTLQMIEKDPNVKYVLLWTSPFTAPFNDMAEQHDTFYKRNCSYKNCYITSNKRLFGYSVTEFDGVLFHGPEITYKNPKSFFPSERSARQSYIFVSTESSHNYYVTDNRYDGFFNFTWTYKINSDINFGYMVIRDRQGKVIGPDVNIPWMKLEDMLPINDTIKSKLANKSIAAAWFVSNCRAVNDRNQVATMIIEELNKFNMEVHVYGKCGNKICPRSSEESCFKMLQRDYYFYFAFENSLSEDYVTEKLLNALQNYAVPLVYGAADYKRYMPDGAYIYVAKTNITDIVRQMVLSIKDENVYHDYFKWHNHYSYHDPEETADTDPYCSLCSFINNIDNNTVSAVEHFYDWWNPTSDIMKTIQ